MHTRTLTSEQSLSLILRRDTDSVMYVHRKGDPEMKTGSQLGEWDCEITAIAGPGARCVSATFTGPKSYCLRIITADGRVITIIKCKGITLTVEASQMVHELSMRGIVLDFLQNGGVALLKIDVPQTQFRSDKRTQTVTTRNVVKMLRVTSNKRVVIGNDTRPFGYCEAA